MDFMTCNSCRKLVHVNNTGICLGCQTHSSTPQPDEWKPTFQEQLEKRATELQEEIKKSKETEDAIQESEAKSVDVCEQTNHGQTVGKRNSKRKKTPSKVKKKKSLAQKEKQ